MLKMPVKRATTLTSNNGYHVLDNLLIEDEDVCFYELLSNDEPLLSDDIWKKFDFEDLPLPGLESILRDLEEDQSSTPNNQNNINNSNVNSSSQPETIRNHDCMWAGHCGSKEHPTDASFCIMNNGNNCKVAVAPGCGVATPAKTPVKHQQQPVVSAGRSLLLKTFAKQATTTATLLPPSSVTTPLGPSPESPPISDDEGHMSPNAILKALYEAIEECEDVDEDSDLCEYFEDAEEEEEEEEEDDDDEEEDEEDEDVGFVLKEEPPTPPHSGTSCKPVHFTPEIDHSYHKGKLPHAHLSGLGIDTPSDSEEEIDVVSVGEKQTILNNNNNRCGYGLPNNPTFKDRQHLQRTMASAIQIKQQQESTDNRRNSSKTTASSFVKPALSTETSTTTTTTTTPVKRHLPEPRAVKRNKINHYRIAPTTSPYKRRLGYSSDSEPEPSEKRSLHNNMERQRRIDLRNAFDCLRLLVPEVAGRERAPKVVILREAGSYCDHLGDVSKSMHQQINDLRKQQERLRARVSQLRRSLAAKR